MRDHIYTDERGHKCTVSEMPIEDIHDILLRGCEIRGHEGVANPEEAIRERLKIELLIREKGY